MQWVASRIVGKQRFVLVVVKKDISVETRSARLVDELVESAAVLDTSKLNAPRFNNAAVAN